VTLIRWLPLAVALTVTLALTSCTQTSSGTPVPDDITTTGDEPDTTDSTTRTEPPNERPRDINLEGKDPCAIPQSDWPRFGIEKPGEPSEHPDFKSPECYYSGDRAGTVALVVTAGIEIWTEETYNAEIKDAEPIDGFHTITVASNIDRRTCWAVVDVADGQFLMATASPDPKDPSNPERCDLAYLLAESALKTLIAS
jgi:hypothetical protein